MGSTRRQVAEEREEAASEIDDQHIPTRGGFLQTRSEPERAPVLPGDLVVWMRRFVVFYVSPRQQQSPKTSLRHYSKTQSCILGTKADVLLKHNCVFSKGRRERRNKLFKCNLYKQNYRFRVKRRVRIGRNQNDALLREQETETLSFPLFCFLKS
ncbi:hypothetical protein L596_004077 [Steinernema carpocapsae]|uniref:Uncharacterized protein n=1 Tax=Steinernema carpocapsae TaxID=34508 RepID=A0A4U8UUJ4_STECR|nr:hypothetical protein L596_004077 [Steinernema carpocapsae]